MYFKYLMMEVASNLSPEARNICQTLSRLKVIQHLKTLKSDVKQFNLYFHGQLTKLAEGKLGYGSHGHLPIHPLQRLLR